MVLAVLLASSNRVVSRDELIERVWNGSPPPAAKTSLFTYLSHLRGELGSGAIEHLDGGYLVKADLNNLDALKFTNLMDAGSASLSSDPVAAAGSFDRALRLWRGAPFGDLGDEPALLMAAVHLEELRLVAEERRIDVYLMLGRHESLVGQLSNLVKQNPFRERFLSQLMVALYRSSRQADALRVFAEARGRFAEELGVDPSPPVWALEERILSHDPGLLYHPDQALSIGVGEMEPVGATLAPPGSAAAMSPLSPRKLRKSEPRPADRIAPMRTKRWRRVVTMIVGVLMVGSLAGVLTWSPRTSRTGCVPLPVLPTAWWSGDNTSSDVMGIHDASLVGDVRYGEGLVNEAFLLSGRGYVDVPHDPSLDPAATDFTLDLWVRFNSTTGEQVLAEKNIQNTNTTHIGWSFTKLPDGSLGFFSGGSSGAFGVVSEPRQIATGRWIHLAVVRRLDTLELFVDGYTEGFTEDPEAMFLDIVSTSSLKLGHRGNPIDTPGSVDASDKYLIGNIDEVHMWAGTALSAAEIGSLADAGAAGACPPA
jgi:DNA-binding SARP family transcriptional activator